MDGLFTGWFSVALEFLFYRKFLSIPVWVWMCVLAGIGLLLWAIL